MSSNESRKNQMASAIVLLCLLITGCHQEENYDQKHQKHVLANDIQRERINRYLYQNEEVDVFKNCKGILDLRAYVKIDQICKDCYNLYREPVIYQECRKNCYLNDYFPACVEVLQLTEYIEDYKNAIKMLNGASPDL